MILRNFIETNWILLKNMDKIKIKNEQHPNILSNFLILYKNKYYMMICTPDFLIIMIIKPTSKNTEYI